MQKLPYIHINDDGQHVANEVRVVKVPDAGLPLRDAIVALREAATGLSNVRVRVRDAGYETDWERDPMPDTGYIEVQGARLATQPEIEAWEKRKAARAAARRRREAEEERRKRANAERELKRIQREFPDLVK